MSRGGPTCPEAGLSVPRRAYLSRGGPIRPEAGYYRSRGGPVPHLEAGLQGCLAHKKTPTPLGPP